jgi:hypothetical protein
MRPKKRQWRCAIFIFQPCVKCCRQFANLSAGVVQQLLGRGGKTVVMITALIQTRDNGRYKTIDNDRGR